MKWPARVVVLLAVHALALTMAAPFVWMVLTALKTEGEASAGGSILPTDPRWANFAEAVRSARLDRFYVNTLWAAGVTTILAGFHNAMAGYALAKLRFAGRGVLHALALASMMLPAQVFFIFAYLIAQRLGYVDDWRGLVVPFLASGFGIYYMRQAIAAVPDALIEAARIDGLRELDILWCVVRPAVWPSISALGVFTFVGSWNSFFWPLVCMDSLEKKTLPLALADLSSGMYVKSWPVQMAAASMLVVPMLVVFVLAQRAFVRGAVAAGLKE